VRSHKKCGPDRFSRFDVYWIQTNKQTDKQTDRQTKFTYRCYFSLGTQLCLEIKLSPLKYKANQSRYYCRFLEFKWDRIKTGREIYWLNRNRPKDSLSE